VKGGTRSETVAILTGPDLGLKGHDGKKSGLHMGGECQGAVKTEHLKTRVLSTYPRVSHGKTGTWGELHPR